MVANNIVLFFISCTTGEMGQCKFLVLKMLFSTFLSVIISNYTAKTHPELQLLLPWKK